ncbi:MAG: MATE family efflux transporter [Lachnospiraceae bacterium]|nr:MATE family efflux transporter [Lachnospiraceae bacterium]
MNKDTKAASAANYDKMVNMPVARLVTRLAIPTIISMMVTTIYSMADTYFVGKLGTSASGAVGVVFGLMAINQALGFMFGHGAGSIVARRLGDKDSDSATRYASVSFFSAIITGVAVTALGLCFISPLMKLLGSTDTILPYARDYGKFILMAAPVSMGSFVLNNILRYEGKAYLSMIGLTLGGIINIALDPICIFVFDLGIAGAGISTAVSQCVSFLILLSMFLMGKTQSKLSFTTACTNVGMVVLVMKTGFPSLLRQGLTSVSTMVLNSTAGNYGDEAVAAMSIVNRICFFVFAVGLGIGQGFQPVAAFNYGAGKYDRVKKSFYFTWIASEIMLGILAVIGIILSGRLVGIFRDDALVIEIGTAALRYQLMALFVQPVSICTSMLFQSVGENKKASWVSMLRSGVCFIPILVVFSHAFDLFGIQIAQPVADVLTFLLTMPLGLSYIRKLGKVSNENT